MYDELFMKSDRVYELPSNISREEAINIIDLYMDKYYDYNDSQEEWFEKMKQLSESLNYATDMHSFKENPDKYKGSIADISNVIRVVFTTKTTTPNLYDILKILGSERMAKRIDLFKE